MAQMAQAHGRPELFHIEELARLEAIPANYLAQILAELRNAGLITSKRGKYGGYALSRPPEEITLYDIVKALDPEMLEFQVARDGQSGERVGEIWKEVQQSLESKTREYTIDHFIPHPPGGAMYYI